MLSVPQIIDYFKSTESVPTKKKISARIWHLSLQEKKLEQSGTSLTSNSTLLYEFFALNFVTASRNYVFILRLILLGDFGWTFVGYS